MSCSRGIVFFYFSIHFYIKIDTSSLWKSRHVLTASRLAQWIQRKTVVREVEGSSPGRTNAQSLKINEENMLPFHNIKKWLDILVFSARDE